MRSPALSTPSFWVVLDTDGIAVGTCASEDSAKEFVVFMNRRGKMSDLRIVEYVPRSDGVGGER